MKTPFYQDLKKYPLLSQQISYRMADACRSRGSWIKKLHIMWRKKTGTYWMYKPEPEKPKTHIAVIRNFPLAGYINESEPTLVEYDIKPI